MGNVFRYHPTPPTVHPVAIWPSLAYMSNGPVRTGFVPFVQMAPLAWSLTVGMSSMLQSCGTSRVRHPESSKSAASAPSASPRWKRQLSLNACGRSSLDRAGPGHGIVADSFGSSAKALAGAIKATAAPTMPRIASRRVKTCSLWPLEDYLHCF
jgi:hypothetical protein